MKVTLGGERLGTGKKNKVDLHGFPRSTHDLSFAFRSTMSAGTLVPFCSELMLPGDKAHVDLSMHMLTLPTNGPLFGSFKIQLDMFKVPLRLYNSWVHNNIFDIGRNISQIKIPKIRVSSLPIVREEVQNIDTAHVNPSCLLAYVGIRGFGVNDETTLRTREFNVAPILGYWDIVKNYYANLQEGIGAVIHTIETAATPAITSLARQVATTGALEDIFQVPTEQAVPLLVGDRLRAPYSGASPDPNQIIVNMQNSGPLTLFQLLGGEVTDSGTNLSGPYAYNIYGDDVALNWDYVTDTQSIPVGPNIETFPLENIDDMRMQILAFQSKTAPFVINNADLAPYKYLYQQPNGMPNSLKSQEGLAVKTYLSDRFNNWLDSEFSTYVNDISAIDTSSGSFNIEQIILSERIYEHYTRIMVSGGSFDDWQEVSYDVRQKGRCEIPIYVGGASGELEFQSVISNSGSGNQPLGTLAGRGQVGNMKGGRMTVTFDETSYLMGLASLTPRLDYSQGNKWDMMLDTWDDFHKPIYDAIGFQELPTEEMAWWDTVWNEGNTTWDTKSAGVQPAWTQYMTNVNRTFGSFAEEDNQMFMTLNRRYTWNSVEGIQDLTTYIDPAKYNYIFAQQSIDAQNFWAQIGVGLKVTRVMSPKVMPKM